MQIIAQENSLLKAAASVARRIATYYASKTDIKSAGAEVKQSQAYRQWRQIAQDFENQSQILSGSPVVNGATESSVFEPTQFDNFGVGRGVR